MLPRGFQILFKDGVVRNSGLLMTVPLKSIVRFMTTREKVRVNTHFLDIIDLKFEKKMPYIFIYFKAFSSNGCLSVSEKYVVTHSFLLGF